MALGTIGLGALLLGGGLAANTYVQKSRADDIKNDTRMILNRAKDKQAELDAERQATLGQALEEAAIGSDQVRKRQDAKADSLVGRMEQNVSRGEPAPNAPNQAGMDGPAGRVMGKAVSREASANEAENSQKRRAMAELDSLGDVLSENDNIFRPAFGEIQANQQIARGEEARIPLAVQAAQARAASRKRGLEIAGRVAQGVGSGLLMGGGGAGANAGAGSGTVSSLSSGPKLSRLPQIIY